MRKFWKLKSALFLALLLIGMLVTLVPQSKAHALTYSAPSWWNGDTCDSTHFNQGAANQGSSETAHLLTTWNGLQVCGYGWEQTDPSTGNRGVEVAVTFPGGHGEFEWDCTELVKRYLYIAYGAPAIGANGDEVVANYAGSYPGLFTSIDNTNGNPNHVWPKVGDVLSYSNVHTAIITGVTITDPTNGNATLNLIEQNADLSGATTQKFISWKIKGGIDDPNDTGSDTVSAWLKPKAWQDISPSQQSGVTKTYINAMAAQNTSTVWEAGYYWDGNYYQPLIEKYDGANWAVYHPAGQSGFGGYPTGIATDLSGNAYAVGRYLGYNYTKYTLAWHWNGSSWDKKVSYNPNGSGQNDFLGVGVDGNGTGWAVGYYGDTSGGNSPGHPLPLLEKWNGSQFVQQTIPLPTDASYAILNSISFDSATDGYIVGKAYYSAQSLWAYVVYHTTDGVNWTVQSTVDPPSVSSTLVSVTAVSSSEAWAVGNTGGNITLVMHYVSGSWNVVGNLPLPDISTTLTSIASDASNEVWAVGYWYGKNQYGYYYNQPFSMRWGGQSWVSFTTPYAGGNEYLNGVAVTANGGNGAWTGGSQTPPNSSASNPIVYAFK